MSEAGTETRGRFALTRNGRAVAHVELGDGKSPHTGTPISVGELEMVGFSVEERKPDVEYGVLVGDIPLEPGMTFGSTILWQDGCHLESSRGLVAVHLRARAAERSPEWTTCARLDVNVVPTKLGDQRYSILVEDVRRVAAGLIFDLVSKMLRGVGYAAGIKEISTRASHLELASLREVWRDLSSVLEQINTDPQLRIGRALRPRPYTGAGVVNLTSAARLAFRGIDPRKNETSSSVMIANQVLTRTSDTVEHRVILGFLRFLVGRVAQCMKVANEQMQLIKGDRHLRDVKIGGQATLYEEVDLPKIGRLQEAVTEGRKLRAQIQRATRLPVFRGVAAELREADTPIFRHVESYYRFGKAMRRYLASAFVILEDGASERMKHTSRLYEHWVFLRLAHAFRSGGLRGDEVQGIVRRWSRHRFVLDLDDDVVLTYSAGSEREVRIRYEPWILPVEAARRRGDILCRDSARLPWRPDVLIEFIERGRLEYAVVVDSKYTKRIQDRHWSAVEKYMQIRTTDGLRQVVRQVWLAYPGIGTGLRCREASVSWTEAGPDRPRDEFIMGEMELLPGPLATGEHGADPTTVARQFAVGLIRYVGFESGG